MTLHSRNSQNIVNHLCANKKIIFKKVQRSTFLVTKKKKKKTSISDPTEFYKIVHLLLITDISMIK